MWTLIMLQSAEERCTVHQNLLALKGNVVNPINETKLQKARSPNLSTT